MKHYTIMFLLLLAGILTVPAMPAHAVIYVDTNVVGSANNGTSWANAYQNLATALTNAADGSEIWVAKGTYTNSFTYAVTSNNVAVYGGFTNGSPWANRDWTNQPTIISGYGLSRILQVTGTGTTRVDGFVFLSGSNATASMAYSTAGAGPIEVYNSTFTSNSGGGFNLNNTAGTNVFGNCWFLTNNCNAGSCIYNVSAGLSVSECSFISNAVSVGAIYCGSSVPSNIFQNCMFDKNIGPSWGAGISFGGTSTNYFTNCYFLNNTSSANNWTMRAGGIFNDTSSKLILYDCIFTNNYARYYGGGGSGAIRSAGIVEATRCTFFRNTTGDNVVNVPGAIHLRANLAGTNLLVNCVFIRNVSSGFSGGAAYCEGTSPSIFANCTFYTNSANTGGAGAILLNPWSGFVTISNCIFYCNVGSAASNVYAQTFSSVYLTYTDIDTNTVVADPDAQLLFGPGIINTNPLFASMSAPYDVHEKSLAGRWDPNSSSWVTDTVMSACIDAGDPASACDQEPFFNGGRVNLGAYGNTTQASKQIADPRISNAGVTGLTSTIAWLNGTLTWTGGAPTTVWVYWGTSDGGSDPTAWGNTNSFGVNAQAVPVSYTTNITGLTPLTTYWYRYAASNVCGTNWASPTASFKTMGTPVVDNESGAVTNTLGFTTLRGTLTDGGLCQIYIYWGTNDGGTVKANWQNYVILTNTPEGVFSNTVSTYWGYKYYYRCYATNLVGDAWASATTNFTSLRSFGLLTVTNGLKAWLDANQLSGYTDGQQVNTWTDMSGSGNHAVRDGGSAAGSPQFQGNQFNGKPVVRFASARMDTPSLTMRTVFAVLNFSGGGTFPNWNTALGGASAGLYVIQGRSGTSALDWEFPPAGIRYVNGVTNLLFTPMTTPKVVCFALGADQTLVPRIGWDRTQASRNWDGDYAEILLYNRVLTSNEMDQVGGYLTFKYGLASTYPALPYGILCITNSYATNVTANSAVLNAGLQATGAVYEVWAYWNNLNAGTDASLWTNSAYIGSYTNLSVIDLRKAVSSLAADTTYYYTFRATNQLEDLWATNVQSFITAAVTLQATDNGASEVGPDTGTYTVTRGATMTNAALNVYYEISGTASNGVDYTNLTGVVVIPTSSVSATISIAPIVDADWAEANETVTLTLLSGGYVIGTPSSDTVTITNNSVGGVYYVDCTRADDSGNGTSWATAFKTLTNAVAKQPGGPAYWVAQGSYTSGPAAGWDLMGTSAFFGGFANTDASFNDRNWTTKPTILDGGSSNIVLKKTAVGQTILDGFTVQGGSNSASSGAGLKMSAGSIIIRNCIFTNNYANGQWGGAVYILSGSTNLITNCTFIANQAVGTPGGAIFLDNDGSKNLEMDIYNSTFIGNTGRGYGNPGGAVVARDGKRMRVFNCEFTKNTKTGDDGGGSAIFAGDGANGIALEVYNCIFNSNTNNGNGYTAGGAVRINSESVTNIISNCTFITNYNTADGFEGGAINIDGKGFNYIINCAFTNNRALGYGGAVVVRGTTTNQITNCTFTGNSAPNRSGGALYVSGLWTDMNAYNCTFSSNSARGYTEGAGAVFGDTKSTMRFYDCVFNKNYRLTGDQAGGAIYSAGTKPLQLFGCDFTDNSNHLGVAGAVWIVNTNPSNIIKNCSFSGNYANGNGGAFYQNGAWACSTRVENCTFYTNISDGNGGAIYLNNGWINITNSIFWNDRAASGPEIYNNSKELTISYCDADMSRIVGGAINYGDGMITADPLFASASAPYDLHLRSKYGRWYNGGWILIDPDASPCIDTGDPSLSYSNEAQPNGGRINMGRYGNTVEASKSGYTSIVVENDNALVTSSNAVSFIGRLVTNNVTPAGVYIFWGETDGGTNQSSWTYKATNGLDVAIGGFTSSVAVVENKCYYWRCFASNAVTSVWSSAKSFVAGEITIAATDNGASEISSDPGVFTISRPSGATAGAATVYYQITGTASNGVDYVWLTTNVTIAAGSASAMVTITPYLDYEFSEPTETVILTLLQGQYKLSVTSNDTVNITNNPVQGVMYVDANIGSEGDGLTWATAYKTLTNAMNRGTGVFWVAQGTYSPGTAVTNTFYIGNNMIFGGFTNGMATMAERDSTNFVTILSGIAGSTNVNNIVTKNVAGYAMIDGFTIKDAIGVGTYGAGVSNSLGSIAIRNCIFTNLFAYRYGAAIYSGGTALGVTNCTFIWCYTTNGNGGAVYSTGAGFSSFSNCLFMSNWATRCADNGGGGAVVIYSAYNTNEFWNCTFRDNFTSNDVNTTILGGALFIENANSPCAMNGCMFSNNYSKSRGGAGYIPSYFFGVTNCTFIGNRLTNSLSMGGGVFDVPNAGLKTWSNCVFISNYVVNPSDSWGGGALVFRNEWNSNDFRNCVFVGNYTTNEVNSAYGGAIRVENASGPMTFTDCAFTNNSTKALGGACSMAGYFVSFTNCSFTGNYTTNAGYGGALYLPSAGLKSISNCVFVSNWVSKPSANQGGAAIALMSANNTNVIRDSVFVGNYTTNETANGYGGAIRMESASSDSAWINCVFTNNRTKTLGGACAIPAYYLGITNCTFVGNYTTNQGYGGALYLSSAGFKSISNCTFVSNWVSLPSDSQGAAAIAMMSASATNVMYDCKFVGNYTTNEAGNNAYGGAIRMESASSDSTLINCSFTNNFTKTIGGACYIPASFVSMTNCTFTGNFTTNNRAGALSLASAGLKSLYGCVFVSNYASYTVDTWGGGALAIETDYDTNILRNCVFVGNYTTNDRGNGYGGAIRVEGANSASTLIDCSFTNNFTKTYGGACHIPASFVSMTNCTFAGNFTTNNSAGSLDLVNAGLKSLSNCVFVNNYASYTADAWGGGALNVRTDYDTNIFLDCVFVGNYTTNDRGNGYGGAIRVEGVNSPSTFRRCVFTNNFTKHYGGAIYAPGRLSVTECDFVGNSSTNNHGGAIYKANAHTNLFMSCSFVSNWAKNDGGGIYFDNTSGTNLILNCTFLTNKANTGYGGAIRTVNAGTVLNITNCILWGDVSALSGSNIYNQAGILNLAYSIINTNRILTGTRNYGNGILITDPLFASAVLPFDIHEQSQYGRYSGGSWVNDGVTSPAIDIGDPAADLSLEPQPNGGRINAGRYGNTVQASKSFTNGMVVVDDYATNVTTASATLVGRLLATNDSPTAVYIYYGETDSFSNKASWGFFTTNGLNVSLGSFTSTVAVAADKLYYWRCYASNNTTSVWAQASNYFITGDVTLQATDNGATELGKAGAFTISRPAGCSAVPITVNYQVSGTADNGADYILLSGSVVMNAGATSTTLVLSAYADLAWSETDETVTLTLTSGSYSIGAQNSDTVTITNNPNAGLYYVDGGVADDTGNGASWAAAFKTLTNAFVKATGEFWVASGTYTPGTVATNTFYIRTNMIYGGFTSGMSSMAQRDSTNNLTTLSGDLGGSVYANNIVTKQVAGVAVIDGFTIRDGRAVGTYGAGVSNGLGAIAIRNCIFTNLFANAYGGAIYTAGTALGVTNCTFVWCYTTNGNGGVVYSANAGFNSFSNCLFVSNWAQRPANNQGGGVIALINTYNTNEFRNCVFKENFTTNETAGGAYGGAIYVEQASSPSALIGCTFSSNYTKTLGGAGYFPSYYAGVTNCTFIGNYTTNAGNGGALRMDSAGLKSFSNCVFVSNWVSKPGNQYAAGAVALIGNFNTNEFRNCVFVGNYSTNETGEGWGGAIRVQQTTSPSTFTDCAFTNNRTRTHGGACMLPGSSVAFTNCTFYDNSGTNLNGVGGAIYKPYDGYISLNNCTFVSNRNQSGGALWLESTNVDIVNCTFMSNFATNDMAGAVYINTANSWAGFKSFSNCVFVSNYVIAPANGWGGGAIVIRADYNLSVFRNCVFSGNYTTNDPATTYGGAIRIESVNSAATMIDCAFSNNFTKSYGGAIYTPAQLSLTRCDFVGNSVTNINGGAIYKDTAHTNLFQNCSFVANWAKGEGGAVMFGNTSGTNFFQNCTFFTNRANTGQGGAIRSYNAGTVLAVTNCIFWGDWSATGGSNIYNAGRIDISYSDLDWTRVNGGTRIFGAGLINTNPLFGSMSPPYDVHVQSPYGRWQNGVWVEVDTQKSSCIDAGNPASAFVLEPSPNGNRINLGRYGNTIEASLSASRYSNSGTLIIVE